MGRIKPETVVSVVLIGAAATASLVLWGHSFSYKSEYELYGENKVLITEDDSYQEDIYKNSVKITGEGGKLKIKGGGARADKDTVYIGSGGSYTLSGEMENVVISTSDSTPVMLELDGAIIESKKQPPIYASKAAKVIISSAPDSVNYITDSRTKIGSSNIDSAVYSVSDITFNGEGEINIEGSYSDAVKTDGVLKLMSGYIGLIADDDGTSSRITVMKDGELSVTSIGDAIKAEADNNTGFIAIDGGKVVVNAESGDGLYSTGDIYINNINADIATGQGSEDSLTKAQKGTGSSAAPGGPPGGMPEDESADESAEDVLPSMKGIKADKNLYIGGGSVVLDSDDDGFHTGGSITIESGNIKLASGDDAIHADESLYINGGILTVTGCYEALESKYMEINAGDIDITAEDDGINVSGTSMGMMPMGPPPEMPGEGGTAPGGGGMPPEMPQVEIDEENVEMDFVMNGGKLRIYSRGDGIDINGSCEINAGDIMAFALQDGPENSFDFDGICKMNGGNFFGTGNPNMAVTPSDSSKCNSLIVYPPQSYQKGSVVKITGTDGTVLVEQTIDGSFGWIGLYGEKLISGETYTVSVNGEAITDATIEQTVTNIQCESADGRGLPGMAPPPGLEGGMGGNQPPGAPPGGMGGNQPPGAPPGGMGGNQPPGAPPGAPPGGMGGNQPPGAPPGGMGGNQPPGAPPGGGTAQSAAQGASADAPDTTLPVLLIALGSCILILIFLFALKGIKRRF